MPDAQTSVTLTASPTATAVVTWRGLLSIYIVIPIMALVMAVDFFFLNSRLRLALPSDPEDWVAFRLLFVLPHIFVGNFIMVDRGYLKHYSIERYIFIISFSLLLYPVLRYTVGAIYFWMIFDIWTIWHGCAQQIGLNRMLVTEKRGLYKIWTLAYFFVILVVFSQMYVSVEIFKIDELTKSMLTGLSLLLFGVSFMFSSPMVKWSLPISIANGSLPAFSCAALYLNYPLFAIIAFRVIHDVTALYIYWVHDLNRNSQTQHNWIHRLSSHLPLPASMRMLAVAFSLAAIVSLYEEQSWPIQYVAISFSLFHYVVETFVWRRDSQHRQYVRFVS